MLITVTSSCVGDRIVSTITSSLSFELTVKPTPPMSPVRMASETVRMAWMVLRTRLMFVREITSW